MYRVLLALCALCAIARADDVRPPDPAGPAKPTGVVTKQPKLLQAVAPDYPPAALAANKQAKVKVRIHIDATGIDHRYPAILAGLPGHPVADVSLERIHLGFAGGGTVADAALRPAEVADAYPEPSMFGTLPAWGLWMRHARDIRIRELEIGTATPDARPPMMTEDVERIAVAETPLWHNRIDQKGRVS